MSSQKKNIHTFLRFRPALQSETQKLPNAKKFDELFLVDRAERSVSADTKSSRKCYNFDKVFKPHESQLACFSEVARPLVKHVLAGLNASIILYGTTGSGKTYTFLGPRWDVNAEKERIRTVSGSPQQIEKSNDSIREDDSDEDTLSDAESENASSTPRGTPYKPRYTPLDCDVTDGLVPRIIDEIFREASAERTSTFDFTVSFVEVYQEQVFDLLTGNNRVYIQDARKGFVSLGAGIVTCYKAHDVMKAIGTGIKNRRVGETHSNMDSSRSHAIIILTVSKQTAGEVSLSQLCLCDLAGSERVEKTKATDLRLEEAKKINSSLLSLRQVIFALSRKSTSKSPVKEEFIPYRNSKLTRLLRNSLGGNAMCSFVCTVSSHEYDYWESIATMEFSQAAATIRNKPRVNKTYTNQQLMKMLKEERVKLMKINMLAISLQEEIAYYKSIFDQHSRKHGHNVATIGLHSLLPFYLCPLSGFIFKDPVVAADGMTYDRSEITAYMARFTFSPVTGKEFKHRLLVENQAIAMQINFLTSAYGALLDRMREIRDFAAPLPDEILCAIVMYLPSDALFVMATICKRWWVVMSSSYLEKQLVKRSDFMGYYPWAEHEKKRVIEEGRVWEWIVNHKVIPQKYSEEPIEDVNRNVEPLLIR